MERYEHLDKAMCKELEKLDKKYTGEMEMTMEDVKLARELYHALKSGETYYAMKEAGEEEYSGEGGNSGRRGGRSYRRSYDDGESYRRSYEDGGESYARGRSPRTGRYVSRDMDYSGHYPMEYIDQMYWDRR